MKKLFVLLYVVIILFGISNSANATYYEWQSQFSWTYYDDGIDYHEVRIDIESTGYFDADLVTEGTEPLLEWGGLPTPIKPYLVISEFFFEWTDTEGNIYTNEAFDRTVWLEFGYFPSDDMVRLDIHLYPEGDCSIGDHHPRHDIASMFGETGVRNDYLDQLNWDEPLISFNGRWVASNVPEPNIVLLMIPGLAGLAIIRKKKN